MLPSSRLSHVVAAGSSLLRCCCAADWSSKIGLDYILNRFFTLMFFYIFISDQREHTSATNEPQGLTQLQLFGGACLLCRVDTRPFNLHGTACSERVVIEIVDAAASSPRTHYLAWCYKRGAVKHRLFNVQPATSSSLQQSSSSGMYHTPVPIPLHLVEHSHIISALSKGTSKTALI